MELLLFKKTVTKTLVTHGFIKNKSYYYLIFKDIIIVIGLQRSSYSNGYYINIGYIITQLRSALSLPKDVDGDIRSRFYIEGNKSYDISLFDLEMLTEDKLTKIIEENIEEYAKNVSTLEDIKLLIKRRPSLLFQTRISAKELLGYSI